MTSELEAASRAFRRAETVLDERRRELAAAIGRASRDGVRQSEIVRVTGYTREHVRKLLKAATEPAE